MDDYNKLLLEKEQKHQEIAARDKEIEKLVAQVQELEHSSTEVSKTVNYLQQQLQKMKKVETELKQVILRYLTGIGIIQTLSSWELSITLLVFLETIPCIEKTICIKTTTCIKRNYCVNGSHYSRSFKQTGFVDCKTYYYIDNCHVCMDQSSSFVSLEDPER